MLRMAPFISLSARICKLASCPPGLWPHCATPWARSSKEFYGNMTGTWPFIRPTSNLWSGRPSKRSSVRLPKAKLTTSLSRSLRKEADQVPRNMHLQSDSQCETFYVGNPFVREDRKSAGLWKERTARVYRAILRVSILSNRDYNHVYNVDP